MNRDEIMNMQHNALIMRKALEKIAEGGFWNAEKYVEIANECLLSLIQEDTP